MNSLNEKVTSKNVGKLKIFLKSILGKFLVLIIILGLLFLVFWKLFPRGFVWLNVSPQGVNLDAGNFSYKNLGKIKLLVLKPGTYVLNYSKDGYISNWDMLSVNFLSFQKTSVILKQMFYVGQTPMNDGLSGSFLTVTPDNNLIYYSDGDQSFYKLAIGAKTYDLPDALGDKIELNLGLTDTSEVSDVRYSPDKKSALVSISDVDQYLVKRVNFETKEVKNIEGSLASITWLANDKLVAINQVNNSNSLVELDLNGNILETLTDLDETAMSVFASNDQKTFLIQMSKDDKDALMVYDSEKNTKNIQVVDVGLVLEVKPSPKNADFLATVSVESGTVSYLVNSSTKTKLEINAYLNNVIWSTDGQSVIYLSYDLKKNIYAFEKYNFQTKKSTMLREYSVDEGDPSDMVLAGNDLYFVLNGSIIGFNINEK